MWMGSYTTAPMGLGTIEDRGVIEDVAKQQLPAPGSPTLAYRYTSCIGHAQSSSTTILAALYKLQTRDQTKQ